MHITNKHRKAARLIAQGLMQMKEICKECEISKQTLVVWKRKPPFQKLIEDYREPLLDNDTKERQLLFTAYKTLNQVMEQGSNESARVSAAKYIVEAFRDRVLGVKKGKKEQTSDDMQKILKLVGK